MKISELKRILKKHKCRFVKNGGSHDRWFSPINGRYFMVPRHDSAEIPNGTKESILKQAGIK